MGIDLTALERTVKKHTPGLMDMQRGYAVLVPLVEREGELCLLYEVRARALRRQPGEVCFPGGRMEGEESPEACALRETWEELSVPPESVHLLGRLDFIAHRAGFTMWPILGLVDKNGLEALKPSRAEVDEVFFVPLSHLLKCGPAVYEYDLIPAPAADFPYERIGIPRDYRWLPGHESVPVYTWEERVIWGLTGRITRHLLSFLK